MNKFFAIAFLCCMFVTEGTIICSAELTGEEILKRSEDAKHNFYSYTQTTEGEGFVTNDTSYVKDLPDGGALLWSESVTVLTDFPDREPERRITIKNGLDGLYWYYPDINLAVDGSYMIKISPQIVEAEKKSKEGVNGSFRTGCRSQIRRL